MATRGKGRPHDMPAAGNLRHGTRGRYTAGCRCDECKAATLAYWHERRDLANETALELGPRTETHCVGSDGPCPKGVKLTTASKGNYCETCKHKLIWNGLVPAQSARHHLLMLSRRGVGRRAVSAATDISGSILAKILRGERKQIMKRTADAILLVDGDSISDRGLVDAGPTWTSIHRLMRTHGYTKARLSKEIGQGGKALQLGKKKVTAKSAAKIQRLLSEADGDFLRR